MELRLAVFKKGLEQLIEFVNTNSIKQGHIHDIIREGEGYRLLYWSKKLKQNNSHYD